MSTQSHTDGHIWRPVFFAGFVAMVILLVVEPLVATMGALPISVNRQIAADNLVTGFLAAFVLYARWHTIRIRSAWDERDTFVHHWGEFLLITGLLIHRPFWIPWRTSLELFETTGLGNYRMFADWWRGDLAAVTSIGQSMWWLGMILMAYPMMRRLMPQGWPSFMLFSVCAVWIVGYQIPDIYLMVAG